MRIVVLVVLLGCFLLSGCAGRGPWINVYADKLANEHGMTEEAEYLKSNYPEASKEESLWLHAVVRAGNNLKKKYSQAVKVAESDISIVDKIKKSKDVINIHYKFNSIFISYSQDLSSFSMEFFYNRDYLLSVLSYEYKRIGVFDERDKLKSIITHDILSYDVLEYKNLYNLGIFMSFMFDATDLSTSYKNIFDNLNYKFNNIIGAVEHELRSTR
ncbi:MAG: hypothetical protein C0622_03625 [Desulfuromonas sp.]|nr:MAG: hypothetical protein C0622_03625 [Desulfuromonas sp.]